MPVTRQGPPVTHASDLASCNPAGRVPPRCQVAPKSSECADQNVLPSVAMIVQSCALAHWTAVTCAAPAGLTAVVQLDPPSRVMSTMPDGAEPLVPTAIQSRVLGHETPVRAGAEASGRGWAAHLRPPSRVVSITVAGPGPGPGAPTAQQRSAPAHDTAFS
jgi:hypothetical protein